MCIHAYIQQRGLGVWGWWPPHFDGAGVGGASLTRAYFCRASSVGVRALNTRLTSANSHDKRSI